MVFFSDLGVRVMFMNRRVVFVIENEWAFGSIHNELSKRLHSRGMNCFFLNWSLNYSKSEIFELDVHVDLWVTVPHGARVGLMKHYGISPSRIGIVSHARSDSLEANELVSSGTSFAFTAAVSKDLLQFERQNTSLESVLLPVRISRDNYCAPAARTLNRVGFAGTTVERLKEIKRLHLIEQACQQANIELVVAEKYHNSWITNTSFYRNVDAVVQASTYEGLGLPQLEAGAAGRLVFTTDVGAYSELVTEKGADLLPMDSDELVRNLVDRINFYRSNPDVFHRRTIEIQEHSRNYDWEHVLHLWEEVVRKACWSAAE